MSQGNKKATIQEILNAAPLLPNWLSEGAVHFIRWALTKEQAKRPTIIALLEHPWIVSHLKGLPNAAKRLLQKAGVCFGLAHLGFVLCFTQVPHTKACFRVP